MAGVCGPVDGLPLKNPGRLTLSTDIPAFPPWWGGDPETVYPNEPAGAPVWETSDPYSMEGFEGATAYAIAERMGFTPELVDWLQNTEFANAFAPGAKAFDFHLAQISIQPDRAEAVDFSEPYLQSNQALVALNTHPVTDVSPSPITEVTTVAGLKDFVLGAAINTTSLELIENVVVPNVEHRAPRSNAAALRALENGQIDGLVVDLGSSFYMRDVQLTDATIVGQFSPELQADPVGAVLELGSPLTDCVSSAVVSLRDDGSLDALYERWVVSEAGIPFFE